MIELYIDDKLFEPAELHLTIRADDPKATLVMPDGILEYEGVRFSISKIEEIRDDNDKLLFQVTGEATWVLLGGLLKVGTTSILQQTPSVGLATLLDGTGWTIGQVTTDTDLYSLTDTDASVLDLVWQWAKVTNNEISFDTAGRRVHMVETIGATRGTGFRYGHNLLSIKRTMGPPQVTRIYPYGHDGLDVTSITGDGAPYIEDYTFYTDQGLTEEEAASLHRKELIWSDDSFLDAQALYNAAATRLELLAQPTLLYECSVVDLRRAGYQAENVAVGDYVPVYDDLLGINVVARVSRLVSYPEEPERNQVELSFNPILLPDPRATNARVNPQRTWELFQRRNTDNLRLVRSSHTILHRLVLRTSENAEWVAGFKLDGVATGNSHVTIEFTNDTDDSPIWPTYEADLVDGDVVDINFTFGEQEIPAGEYIMVVRAYSDSSSAGLDIAQSATAFWFLAQGTTLNGPTLANSERFDWNGNDDGNTGASVQSFTVPDDVTEIQVEAHGAQGGPRGTDSGGKGGKVIARIPVVAGTQYDIYVGGSPASDNYADGGWPNGGGSPSGNTIAGYGGGGSTHMFPTGTSLASAVIVAAGGGGSNRIGASRPAVDAKGGFGGFYEGQPGYGLGPVQTPGSARGGGGATQSSGGVGDTTDVGNPGQDGSFGQGGNAAVSGNFFHFAGGGGGGGWYGGGGAGYPASWGGGSFAGDGGGGSGYLVPQAWDIEIEDDENAGHGYLIISWATPVET